MTRVTPLPSPDTPDARRGARRAGRVLVVLALAWIAAMTLVPQPEMRGVVASTSPWCLVCGDTGLVDTILNVILFVPYGAALRLAGVSWRRLAVTLALTTISIELLQMKVVAGRDASLGDVLTNFAGGVLGAWLVTHVRWLLTPTSQRARRLALAGALAWLGLTTVVGWLEERVIPYGHYVLAFARELPGHDRFSGHVLGAAVNDVPIDTGHVANAAAVTAALQQDSARFAVRFLSGRPTARRARIAELGGALTLEQQGRDAVFSWRLRTQEFRLRSPTMRLRGVLPATAGDTVLLVGAYGHDRLWLTAVSSTRPPTPARTLAVALSPSWSWAMLLPFEYDFGPEVSALTALWLAALLFLPGYWAGWAGTDHRHRWFFAVVAGVIVAGLAGVPVLVTLPAVPWTEWLGAVGGALGGWLLGAALARWRHVDSSQAARDDLPRVA